MIFKCLLAVLLSSLVSAGQHPGPEERIAGGSIVNIEDAPYMVAIFEDGVYACGGAVYSERIVLTAAHCIEIDDVKTYSVRAGSSLQDRGGQVVVVQKAYLHEDFDSDEFTNDIAVLYLKDPLKLNPKKIRPIELTEKKPKSGSTCLVTGWGKTSSEGNNNELELRGVNLTILNVNDCRHKFKITKERICALAPGKDSCEGDSGGPLVSLPDFKLIGIVSWGSGKCPDPGVPGVYEGVYHLRDWIRKTIRKVQKKYIHN
ncbi:hypothetical protein KR032_004280 [Drosophila birchii]|nr:hypothetical protein KR032_004280 [Drosophila birchii]